MPLRVNLLAENLAVEELRRRDPVKRLLVAGVLLISVMLVWWGFLQLKQVVNKRDLAQVLNDINAHTNEYSALLADQKKNDDTKAHLDALYSLNTNRFLQASLLNALQMISVPGVQLTRLHVGQTYTQRDAKKADPGKANGVPAASVERIVLTLDLKDSSPNPGDGVNKYKDALMVQPYLQSMLDVTNGIRMSGLYGLQTTTDGKQYEIFTLECRFPEIDR
jgi:hypothetical protein